jgi:hypothetical protein
MQQKDKNAAACRDFLYERISGDWSVHQASAISRHFLIPTENNHSAVFRRQDGFLGAFTKLRRAIISVVMSVCPSAWNISAPTRRIFFKSDI